MRIHYSRHALYKLKREDINKYGYTLRIIYAKIGVGVVKERTL